MSQTNDRNYSLLRTIATGVEATNRAIPELRAEYSTKIESQDKRIRNIEQSQVRSDQIDKAIMDKLNELGATLGKMERTAEMARDTAKEVNALRTEISNLNTSVSELRQEMRVSQNEIKLDAKKHEEQANSRFAGIEKDIASVRNLEHKKKSEWFSKILWIFISGLVGAFAAVCGQWFFNNS